MSSSRRRSLSDQYWSSRSSLPRSPIGMTSMKVRSKPRSPHQATRSCSSSSLTPLSATVLILTRSPASTAASMPSITWAKRPQRVIFANFAASRVSSETLTRRTPQSASSPAKRRSWLPLVVSVSSLQRAGREVARHGAEEGHDALADQRLAAGDAQLLDAEADEGRAEPVELLERQQLGLGQELHVLGHAVDAAEVAAVGDRHAQVGDRARERVDQAWHVGQVVSPCSERVGGARRFKRGAVWGGESRRQRGKAAAAASRR